MSADPRTALGLKSSQPGSESGYHVPIVLAFERPHPLHINMTLVNPISSQQFVVSSSRKSFIPPNSIISAASLLLLLLVFVLQNDNMATSASRFERANQKLM